MIINNVQNNIVVSFIITDYNLPTSLLRECIESILSLDIRPDEREIILIDDGSDVSPAEAINDLMPQIICIRQQNQGLSMARNNGIEIARGRFIQFVDGDDCVLPNYNECLRSMREDNFDILFFHRLDEKKIAAKGKTCSFGSGASYMLNHNIYASAWGYIFRKELLSEGLRFTRGILHEDEEFTPLLILLAKKVARYDGAAYFYRKRENSIIHRNAPEHLKRRFTDFVYVIERLSEIASTLCGDSRKALFRRVNQLVMDHIYNVMATTHDIKKTNEAIRVLEEKGLFPLPIKTYTLKYLIFSIISRNTLGNRIIMKCLNL